ATQSAPVDLLSERLGHLAVGSIRRQRTTDHDQDGLPRIEQLQGGVPSTGGAVRRFFSNSRSASRSCLKRRTASLSSARLAERQPAVRISSRIASRLRNAAYSVGLACRLSGSRASKVDGSLMG